MSENHSGGICFDSHCRATANFLTADVTLSVKAIQSTWMLRDSTTSDPFRFSSASKLPAMTAMT